MFLDYSLLLSYPSKLCLLGFYQARLLQVYISGSCRMDDLQLMSFQQTYRNRLSFGLPAIHLLFDSQSRLHLYTLLHFHHSRAHFIFLTQLAFKSILPWEQSYLVSVLQVPSFKEYKHLSSALPTLSFEAHHPFTSFLLSLLQSHLVAASFRLPFAPILPFEQAYAS